MSTIINECMSSNDGNQMQRDLACHIYLGQNHKLKTQTNLQKQWNETRKSLDWSSTSYTWQVMIIEDEIKRFLLERSQQYFRISVFL